MRTRDRGDPVPAGFLAGDPPVAVVVVARERIRQIQTGTERRIRTACGHELRFLAGALHNELAPSAEQSALHRRIDDLLPNGVGPTEELVTTLFRQVLLDEMGLTPNQSEGLQGGIAR